MATQHTLPLKYFPVGNHNSSVYTNSNTIHIPDTANATNAAGLVNLKSNVPNHPFYEYRVQSSLFCNDQGCYNVAHINKLLE
jgi:hypothetical protein